MAKGRRWRLVSVVPARGGAPTVGRRHRDRPFSRQRAEGEARERSDRGPLAGRKRALPSTSTLARIARNAHLHRSERSPATLGTLALRCRRRRFAVLAMVLRVVTDADVCLHRSEALAVRCPSLPARGPRRPSPAASTATLARIIRKRSPCAPAPTGSLALTTVLRIVNDAVARRIARSPLASPSLPGPDLGNVAREARSRPTSASELG